MSNYIVHIDICILFELDIYFVVEYAFWFAVLNNKYVLTRKEKNMASCYNETALYYSEML